MDSHDAHIQYTADPVELFCIRHRAVKVRKLPKRKCSNIPTPDNLEPKVTQNAKWPFQFQRHEFRTRAFTKQTVCGSLPVQFWFTLIHYRLLESPISYLRCYLTRRRPVANEAKLLKNLVAGEGLEPPTRGL